MAAAGGSGGGADDRTGLMARPLPRGKTEVSLSAFGYVFSELVQYCQNSVVNVPELERKLENVGHDVGVRFLEVTGFRDKPGKRETKLLGMLQFMSTTFWNAVFGKNADGLEKSRDSEDEFMIVDNDPVTNRFISVPTDFGRLSCTAYVAGMPARVTAHVVEKDRTVILIKFEPEAMERQ